MQERKKPVGMIRQLAVLFLAGVILIGVLSSAALYYVSLREVKEQLTTRAQATAMDLEGYIRHYPAHDWLLRYWYEHYDQLDIEYDAEYSAETVTAQKYRLLIDHVPSFQAEYAVARDIEALSAEDQKLYAEITYSWLISRIDHIQLAYDLDFLLCVITDAPYDRQFVLFIAAEEGEERGTEPGQLYPIGRTITVSDEIRKAVQTAVTGQPQDAPNRGGKYRDYYFSLGSFDDHDVLLVLTIDVMRIRQAIMDYVLHFGMLYLSFMIALAAVCLTAISVVVLRPLRIIQKTIRMYKETKDSDAAEKSLSGLRSRNELSQLSADVADLAKEIDDYTARIEEISSARERRRIEMNLAGRIQSAMLPNDFQPYGGRTDYEIYATMDPAREVGGDFYDFFLIDDRHLCLIVADVSGKSVPAALFMMAAKITLSHHTKTGKSPARILADTNEAICSANPEEMFVTVWLGILDLNTGILTAANAGHEYPMLKEPGGDFSMVMDRHGFVLGGMDRMEYQEYEIRMAPGSKLFLYTDGLPEAIDPQNRMFGTERILKVLNACRDGSPEQILKNMRKSVDEHVCGMEPFDDLTMMCLTYNGPDT